MIITLLLAAAASFASPCGPVKTQNQVDACLDKIATVKPVPVKDLMAGMHDGHKMPFNPTRIEMADHPEPYIEIPGSVHNHIIDPATLVKPTVAYCIRSGQVRCENSVSDLSGGASVVVTKKGTRWTAACKSKGKVVKCGAVAK